MINKFKKFLESQNIQYNTSDKPYSLRFSLPEGFICEFTYFEEDPFYFQIVIPYLIEIEDSKKDVLLEVATTVTTDVKGIKMVSVHNYLWIAIQQFLPDVSPLNSSSQIYDLMFTRIISVLETALEKLKSTLEEKFSNGTEKAKQ